MVVFPVALKNTCLCSQQYNTKTDGSHYNYENISYIASDGDSGDGVMADPFIGRLLSWLVDFLRNNFAMNN
uniref:Uncharacterized protein n=1 Tax=Glossina palpalis gambiensis TaxID=67801 RepID=A0A1B0B889_9MUSC